jgi:LacI family transcriptional regulator
MKPRFLPMVRTSLGMPGATRNDQLAIGLMRGLAQLGARVPGDVSVVGFDHILTADLVTPGLTTVAAPLRAMGTRPCTTSSRASVEHGPAHVSLLSCRRGW